MTTSQEERRDRYQLGRVIEDARSEIADRWLVRLQTEVVGERQIPLTALRDGIDDYLRHISEELAKEDGELVSGGTEAWVATAEEHGVTRVRQGFDIGQLVHEFVVLRHVMFEVIAERQLSVRSEQFSRIADLIEAAIITAVKSYVDARDYDSRRSEAEHIGFISHELRNPLASATLAASQLRKIVSLSPSAAHAFDILERNQRRLKDLIEQVLDIERLESGEANVRPVEIELGRIMTDATSAASAEAELKHLRLALHYNARLRLRVDPGLTRSIIANLVDNAVKYTDSGDVEVRVDEMPRDIVVHVRDNCSGISAEELRIIFEPFRRGRTQKRGAGLGLSIALRAAEAQGGALAGESAGQRGCHFWLRLPKQVAASAPPPPQEMLHAPDSRGQ